MVEFGVICFVGVDWCCDNEFLNLFIVFVFHVCKEFLKEGVCNFLCCNGMVVNVGEGVEGFVV